MVLSAFVSIDLQPLFILFSSDDEHACVRVAGFARFMETDEPAPLPQRSALVHPDAVAVHIPSSLSAEEPVFRVSPRVTDHTLS